MKRILLRPSKVEYGFTDAWLTGFGGWPVLVLAAARSVLFGAWRRRLRRPSLSMRME